MKLIQRLSLLFIYTLAVIPSLSFAHTIFTYTSNKLPLIEGYLNGDLRDISMIEDPYLPPMSISLAGELENFSGTFLMGDLMVGFSPEYQKVFTAIPVSDGSITVDESGVAQAWSFILSFTKTGFDMDNGPERDTWFVRSEHGANTCNCDTVTNERDLYIPRAYEQWAYAATLGELFIGENSADNWSTTSINVSEPPIGLLMLCGLFCLGLTKRARRILQ